jgi:small subunit ribosomal protein S8
MTMSDTIGDMLTRIRNGQRAMKGQVSSPASKEREGVLQVLQSEGFIRGFSRREVRKGIDELVIELKYHEGGPVIREVARVSKPGRRVYTSVKAMPRTYGGLGIQILSTSKGILSDSAAREANVGGEILCEVF